MRVRDTDPQAAREIARAVTQAYKDFRLSVRTVPEIDNFFQERIEEVRAQLEDWEERRVGFMAEESISKIDDERYSIMQVKEQAEKDLTEVNEDLAADEARGRAPARHAGAGQGGSLPGDLRLLRDREERRRGGPADPQGAGQPSQRAVRRAGPLPGEPSGGPAAGRPGLATGAAADPGGGQLSPSRRGPGGGAPRRGPTPCAAASSTATASSPRSRRRRLASRPSTG